MIGVGNTVTLFDGTVAVVQAVKCTACDSHQMHMECTRWLKVAEKRWVSEAAATVIA